MLRVSVLGDLRIERDGEEVALPASWRGRSILGWLALHPGVHPRGRLASRFWPDVLDASARANLRNALWSLRRAVGGDHLLADREHVGLLDCWVDAGAFDELVAAGRGSEALELCRGDLLAGLEDDWVLEARAERTAALGVLLERLAGDAQAAGDLPGAIALSRRWAALDPTGEPGHRALMRRLMDAGDRSAALAVYERLSARLASDLRAAPSPETRALAEELRGATAGPAPVPARPARLPARLEIDPGAPFVGRAAELERLRAAWARDATRLVLVTGEPGIGKTRLLRELAVELHRAGGAAVLHGAAHAEAALPFEAWAQALPAEVASPEPVRAVLDALAARAPALLVLDDLHQLDGASARLLGQALRAEGRLLVAASHRPREVPADHPLHAVLDDARRAGAVEEVALGGLSAGELDALAGGVGEELLAASGGNPLFALELARGDRSGPVPDGIGTAVAARLARLPEPARRRLEHAAVIGAEVDLDLLERLAGDGEDAFLGALDVAIDAGLLVEIPGRADRCAFRHAVVRETILAGMTAARRRRLHARVADQLEALGRAEPARMAHHLSEAGPVARPERLLEWALLAGERAAAQHAYGEEVAVYSRALEVVPEEQARALRLRRAVAFQALTHQVFDVRS